MNINNDIIHVGFNCPENIPEDILNELLEDLDRKTINLQVKKLPTPFYNMLDWAIPGIIAAYILKPYFESFLKEAGKDHYHHLNKWLKSLITKARRIKVRTISASQSTKKLDPTYTQSKAISIYCQAKNDKIIKLLFDEMLSAEDWENSIDKILELLAGHYASTDNSLSEKVNALDERTRTIYAFIDQETKEWIFKDDHELVQIRISKSERESE